MDVADVQVQCGSGKPATVGALAYAQGSEIHLGPGQEQHLPHEAWQVVQQRQGRVNTTMQAKGGEAVNDDAALEQEADEMGARMQQSSVTSNITAPAPDAERVAAVAAGPIQRVATGLIAGLDAAAPSTYDTGGGHSYADHGAHTTKEQHVHRVKTGVAPSGRVSKVPKGKPSSKFDSNASHALAFKTALAGIEAKNKNLAAVKGAANVIDVPGAGTLFYADGATEASSKVTLDIQPVDATTIRINSMYATKG